MKKLMIAAAVAACAAGAFAAACAPEAVDVARVYQMQMNAYTTVGKVIDGIGGSQCAPGACAVARIKGKSMLRGYIYVCGDACELKDYLDVFADAYHNLAFFSNYWEAEKYEDITPCLKWDFMHAIGKNMTDAETAWSFKATVAYENPKKVETARTAEYDLKGAGYGQFSPEKAMFNNFSGTFAGIVSASYDFTSARTSANAACVCTPSMVVLCDSDGAWVTDEEGTIAFGTWKMKYNSQLSAKLAVGKWNPLQAIAKVFSH